jgi:hypothetical protein
LSEPSHAAATDWAKPTPRERWAGAIASSGLIWLCAYTLAIVHGVSFSRPTDTWQHRLFDLAFRFLLSELCVAFIAFCAIVFVWFALMQEWSFRVLHFLGRHVWFALLGFSFGCVLIGVVTWIGAQIYGQP